jgi:hypothetical protein
VRVRIWCTNQVGVSEELETDLRVGMKGPLRVLICIVGAVNVDEARKSD